MSSEEPNHTSWRIDRALEEFRDMLHNADMRGYDVVEVQSEAREMLERRLAVILEGEEH